MQNGKYPIFTRHLDVTCFHCDMPIGIDPERMQPIHYGFPRGAYGMWCESCKLRTYYDTDDKTVSFDAKGDPLPPTCSCGCTVPQSQWDDDQGHGWPRCPDCGMV